MSALDAISAIARLTWWRLTHGRGTWLAIAVAILPIPFAFAIRDHATYAVRSFEIEQAMLVVLPAVLVGVAFAAEVDDGRLTYLLTRPLARWTIVAGTLLVVAPCAIALVLASWIAMTSAVTAAAPTIASMGALAAGAVAATTVATAMVLANPRYGTLFALIYMLCDGVIGQIPAQLQRVSIAHDVAELAAVRGSSPLIGAIGLTVIVAIAVILAFRRIRTFEA